MNHIKIFVRGIFCSLVILLGLLFIISGESILSGILFFVSGLFFLDRFNQYVKEKYNFVIPTFLKFLILISAFYALASMDSSIEKTHPKSMPTEKKLPVSKVPTAPKQPISKWEYSDDKDEMTGKLSYYAFVNSDNTVNFKFPYSGEQHATLELRTHPRFGKDVILEIKSGQFLCPSYSDCTVLVRFDDNNPVRYTASAPSDGSSNFIFIRNYSKFLSNLSRSKRVRISAEVYQEGNPIFEFNVSGFDSKKYVPQNKK